MGASPNPRQALKELLEGRAPARPLFLPIVFALGARVENVSLRTFLSNPTKIVSALRQVRAHLPADGVTCYFDPFLEAEALGGELAWESDEGPPQLHWPGGATRERLPAAMGAPDLAARGGRVSVAVEVIRRMKDALRGSALLMAGLSGPLALASRLLQCNDGGPGTLGVMPAAAVEAAGAALGEIARALVEAGADVVLIQERIAAGLDAERVEEGMSQLHTAINIIRFYEALPVLLVAAGDARGPLAACGGAASACIVCAEWNERAGGAVRAEAGSAVCGISLPVNAFDGVESAEGDARLADTIREVKPALVTTAGDISRIANLKRLAQLKEAVNA